MDIKRLFFAFEIEAPWPESYPQGRILRNQDRHLTVAFLGSVDYNEVKKIPKEVLASLHMGSTGYVNEVLFLPPKRPRVVAWHANLLQDFSRIDHFYHSFIDHLVQNEMSPSHPDRNFLPHITLCRSPFTASQWRNHFTPLPFLFKKFHLYESVGNLIYEPLWTQSLIAPFEEIEHTADIAFIIRGVSLQHLHQNAMMAMAFHDPQFLSHFDFQSKMESLDDLIIQLNSGITKLDTAEGSPFKAVSFHGEIKETEHYMEWEMIIDV